MAIIQKMHLSMRTTKYQNQYHPVICQANAAASSLKSNQSTQRRRRQQINQILYPLVLTLLVSKNYHEAAGGAGLCLAAEALATPFLHHQSFLFTPRGGSIVEPPSTTTSSSLFPSSKSLKTSSKTPSSSSLSSCTSEQSSQPIRNNIIGATNTNTYLQSSSTDTDASEPNGASASAPEAEAEEEMCQHLLTRFIAESHLPSDIGQFRLRAYRIVDISMIRGVLGEFVGKEPCVIYAVDKPPGFLRGNEDESKQYDVPVRIHDQCFTSEVLRSKRCDCREQLELALNFVLENGGAIIYLQQEGRGIGVANKVAAYALQDTGMDTVEANIHLGFPEDCRQYGVVPSILSDMGIESIQLMTNNPRKVERLKALGVNVTDTVPMVVQANKYNRKYLETKREKMSHKNFGAMLKLPDAEIDDTVSHVLNGMHVPTKSFSKRNGFGGGPSSSSSGSVTSQFVNGDGKTLLNQVQDDDDDDDDDSQSGVKASDDGYCFGRQSVEDSIAAVARGEIVVVVDDENRENEGDFIMAADLATPETMATIVRFSSGVVCLGMEGSRMDELKLPSMVSKNEDPKGTAFSVSVDATKDYGITTGISATDRAVTVRMLANSKTTAKDFHRPGHIFPLRAKENGVLTRDGHTEAAVDLARLAGCSPAGVLCEIVSEENPVEMARLPELKRFCKRHGYVMTSIVDIAQYRRDMESNERE